MVTFNILLVVILVVAFLLILAIMVQQPKGGGLSSSLTGAGQVVGGVKKTTDFLDKATWTLASVLIACIILANIVIKSEGGASNSRVLEGFKPEKTSVPQLPQTPTTPNK